MNKVALVTGGASGMGRLSAINLCEKGMKVAILDLNDDGLKETSENEVSTKSTFSPAVCSQM